MLCTLPNLTCPHLVQIKLHASHLERRDPPLQQCDKATALRLFRAPSEAAKEVWLSALLSAVAQVSPSGRKQQNMYQASHYAQVRTQQNQLCQSAQTQSPVCQASTVDLTTLTPPVTFGSTWAQIGKFFAHNCTFA
ncbi:unnamed protein product [Protopolystoma xenopodis]|uniref:PH domain-containing protein n=1 Tax=Protopolystoma xenopodis TaxID=117903 RepID=A0A448X7Z2_9PLAT|nr:unnamed protein product [Protopolystoma xenopodis]